MNPRLLVKSINTIIQNVKKNNKINYLDLMSIPSSKNKENPIYMPQPFLKNLDKIGEQTISYMEKVSKYKKMYESQSSKNKPSFIEILEFNL